MTIASIDVGTNTIILLIAEVDVHKKQISSLYNEQRIPRLGKGLIPGKPILKRKIIELLNILEEYDKVIKKYNCEKIFITATNALRSASNKNEIQKIVKDKLNYDVNIVSGEDEAELTFKGAVFQFEDNYNSIVIDIGGGSTEVIFGDMNEIRFKKSFQLGVVSAIEKYLKHSPPRQSEIIKFENELAVIFADLKEKNFNFKRAVAIAGTPTTLAAIKLNLPEYDEDLLEGCVLNSIEIERLISELVKLTNSEITQRFKSVVKGREDVILSGAIILLYLIKLMGIDEISVSTKGIRYGAVCRKLFSI